MKTVITFHDDHDKPVYVVADAIVAFAPYSSRNEEEGSFVWLRSGDTFCLNETCAQILVKLRKAQ